MAITQNPVARWITFSVGALYCLTYAECARSDEIKPAGVLVYTHRVGGLFSKEREADLCETFKRISDIELMSIDFAKAEATFRYDEKKLFGNGTPQQIADRFDSLLAGVTIRTFRIKPPLLKPREKLTAIEIAVGGLDCKGCCYATYQAIAEIPGVEQATASFRDGLVTALIDPEKTNRESLVRAIKDRGIDVKTP